MYKYREPPSPTLVLQLLYMLLLLLLLLLLLKFSSLQHSGESVSMHGIRNTNKTQAISLNRNTISNSSTMCHNTSHSQ